MLKRVCGLIVAVCVSCVASAGPITPPPGPVASTGKTLVEVEPRLAINTTNTPGDANSRFKITSSGSYYLTGNLTAVIGRHGLEIAVSNVTIDLMGFTVQALTGNQSGITTEGVRDNITILNGVVSGWGGDGINLSAEGIGKGARIIGVTAIGNGGFGIRAGDGAVVRDCIARANGATGISAENSSVFTNCTSTDNTGTGIFVNNGSTITGCTARENGGTGISAGTACSVQQCTSVKSGEFGIETSFGTIISNCVVRFSALHGISATMGSCRIIGNTCDSNGDSGLGAGVNVATSDVIVEENVCIGNDWGIRVLGSGNLIVRNSCSGNTTANFDISTQNRYGPIVNITAATAPGAVGNAAASTLSTTDAWANFAY